MTAVEWDSVSLAGAFLLGAIFATIMVIRVVRAVMTLFDEGPHRPPWRHRDNNKEEQ